MRKAGKILAQALNYLQSELKPGVTTKYLADLAAAKLEELGGEPVFLDYNGFPDVICISVNDEVVHGIPGPTVINAGDIVGLDFGVQVNGLICDGAVTVAVGEVEADAKMLLTATQDALKAGIAQVKAGVAIGDISHAIEQRLRADKLGVVEDLMGHGVGHSLHEEPGIPNFGPAGKGMKLKAGMTIAIEPMATLGSHEVDLDQDGWTIRTTDGSLAAQFEHTVLVTKNGAEILTQA